MKVIQIALIDDQVVIDGIKSFLNADPTMEVIMEACSGEEALEKLKNRSVDVAVVDLSMPEMNGIELTRNILDQDPTIKVIALTMMAESQHIKEMMGAGASGFLLKNSSAQELHDAVKKVLNNEIYYSKEVAEIVMMQLTKRKESRVNAISQSMDLPLTNREKEVLHLIVQEYSNRQIAEKLFISLRTVDAHKRNLLEKTGSKNVAGLVKYAMVKQLFDDL